MKIFTLIIILIFHTGSAMAEDFKVTITQIDTQRGGNLVVFIYGKEGFPKEHDKAIQVKTIKVAQAEAEVLLSSDSETLAIKVLHDENGDGKVTKNWTGIVPKDGLGFSKNQKLSLRGVPKYEKSKLSKSDYLKGVNIQLIYY